MWMNLLKRIFAVFFSIAFIFSSGNSIAQILTPVKWSFVSENVNDKEATLVLKAKIENKFHIYSQFLVGEGPIPTTFTFNPSSDYELNGKVTESKPIEEYDPNFDMKLKYFNDHAEFRQKIKIKSSRPFKVTGVLNFMACDDHQCLPPADVDFSFNVNPSANGIKESEKIPSSTDTAKSSEKVLTIDSIQKNADSSNSSSILTSTKSSGIIKNLEPGCGSDSDASVSSSTLWGIFIGGILGGLLALLTPCVFPMIPMTVSFFTKRSKNRKKGITNAFLYALFIIFIYVGLGLLVTVTLGSDALNDLASNAFFNLSFFVIFIIFALSFFGAFEIVLPSALVNRADAASDRGGLIGIFFMAFTLSLVSFSCTGPIIGTLLVEAAHGRSYLGPLIGMTGFALALALPFAFFAAFPGYLNSLPKSGGWLNSVKVVLGFIELALALKFLSNVDLAYHWGILKRETFISIWIIIFGLMGLYLLGRIRFSHDSEVSHISVTRLIFSIITLSFTLYLIPGLWGAPLQLISGFPPPDFYKEWKTQTHDCPHDLNCFHDFDEGMAYAKSQSKPVMIDFTGWSCVNCRKMEDNVWSDPKVLKRLSEQYVLISLYVDDKETLAEEKQIISPTTGKKIKTTGNKWSDFQSSKYDTNTQPYYVLIDNNENLLAKPRGGYMPDISAYVKFLDEGLCRYSLRKRS
jgi:thiol:disulfide interchange protein